MTEILIAFIKKITKNQPLKKEHCNDSPPCYNTSRFNKLIYLN